MTSRATKTDSAPEVLTGEVLDAKPAAPEKPWGVFTMKGRPVVFQRPNPEQLMVLRRLARHLDEGDATPSRKLILMAKILDAASALMTTDDERDYVDQLVLERKVDIDELGPMIQVALVGDEGLKSLQAPKNGPARRVRRR